MPWKDLAKNALLGVENSSFQETTLAMLAQLGVDTAVEAPILLASSVALLTQMRKAGFILEDFKGELPVPNIFNSDKTPSLKTAHHLHLILSGTQSPVLGEFLFLIKKSRKNLPTSEIPALMQLPEINQVWPEIELLLGETGHWLLRQHPEWSLRLQDPIQFNWQTGTRSERILQLKFWRHKSPSFALELLSSSWDSESPADKTAFLSCLKIGLSLADEPLLEQCLDDRRKEVRQAAAPLLAKIPDSQLSKRMAKRAETCFLFVNNSLKINNLEEPELAAQRDGVLQINPKWEGGSKAGHLGQMVSLVPPSHWECFFEKPPTEILDLFSKTDWSETLIRASLEATVFHQNPIWATAIFDFWQKNQGYRTWESSASTELAALLPANEVNRLALKFLKESSGLPSESTPVFRLLKNSDAAWTDELSLLIINRFRMEIVKDYRQIWQLLHLSGYLQMLGLRCNPALYDQLQTNWSSDSVQWRNWEKQVEDMLARVLFRGEIWKELGVNPAG